MTPRTIALVAVVATLGVAGLLYVQSTRTEGPYPVPGLDPMTPETLAAQSYVVAPALLSRIHAALGETEGAALRNELAEVAAGDGLDVLYRQRSGAMAGGGLAPGQPLHEVAMLRIDGTRSGDMVTLDATWRVLGTVESDEHQHVEGGIYAADLVLKPVDGAWRITGFDLKEVGSPDSTRDTGNSPKAVLGIAD